MDVFIQIVIYFLISLLISTVIYSLYKRKVSHKPGIFINLLIFIIPSILFSTLLTELQKYVGRDRFDPVFLGMIVVLITMILITLLLYNRRKK